MWIHLSTFYLIIMSKFTKATRYSENHDDGRCEYAKGSPEFENVKQISKEIFAQHKHAHDCEREKAARKFNADHKPHKKGDKIQKGSRSSGKKFKHEGLFSACNADPADDTTFMDMSLWAHATNHSSGVTQEKMYSYCAKVATYAGAISTCENSTQFFTATLQFIAGIASEDIVRWFSERQPVVNEGVDGVLTSIRNFVQGMRGGYADLQETPVYKYMMDVLGMAAVCGFCDELTVFDCKVVSAEWMKSVKTRVMSDFPSVILRAIEFSLEVATTVIRGESLSGFVSSRGVMTTVFTLLGREQDVKSRMLERKHGIKVADHLAQCMSVRVQLKEMLKTASTSVTTLASQQLAKLEQHIALVHEQVKTSGFRPRPFCVMLAGPSAVGKSCFLNELYAKMGQVCGFEYSPENVAEITDTDKFDSPITGTSTIYQMDDMCQSKNLHLLPETPQASLVRYNNTAPSMAVKADVAEKGSVPIEPSLIAITTNDEYLQAAQHMTNPMALLKNRINEAVWVRPKEYCRGDDDVLIPDKMRDDQSNHVVQRINYTYNNGRVTATRGPEEDIDRWLVDALKHAKAFKEHQESLRELFHTKGVHDVCVECCEDIKRCKCFDDVDEEECVDAEEPFEKPEKFVERSMISSLFIRFMWAVPWLYSLYQMSAPVFSNESLFTDARDLLGWNKKKTMPVSTRLVGYLKFQAYFHTRKLVLPLEIRFARLISFFFWKFMRVFRVSFVALSGLILLTSFFLFLCYSWVVAVLYLATMAYMAHLIWSFIEPIIIERIISEVTTMSREAGYTMGTRAIDTVLDNIVMISAFVPILACIRMYCYSLSYSNEGNILTTSKCTIRERREEPNEWLKAPAVVPIRAASEPTTSTLDDASEIILRRCCKIEAPGNDGVFRFNGINACGDWIIVPYHCFKECNKEKLWSFEFSGEKMGSNRRSLIDTESICRVRKDHVAFRVFKLNKNGDIRAYFPEEPFHNRSLTYGMLYRKNDDWSIDHQRLRCTFDQNAVTVSTEVAGWTADLKSRTKSGDCGSPWVREASPHVILGLHNGRSDNTGLCETIYRSDLDFMTQVTFSQEGGTTVVKVASPPLVELETELFGEEIMSSTGLHAYSCMHYCTEDAVTGIPLVEAYGSCESLRYSFSHSSVTRSPLSGALEECGLPCQWGQPPLHVNRNHEEVFKIASHPLNSIAGKTMAWAVDDYVMPIISDIQRLDYRTSPLTEYEIYNGRPSEVINPMNMDTSPGIGLPGKKKDHCEVTVTETGKTYTPKEYISCEVSRLREKAQNGERTCPIAKTALKDEPTKLTKQVARMFYVMPMAFIAVSRQVLCPILAFMMANPIITESWQAVRTTTNEWGQCYEFLNKFGNKKMMNGDYSKYDLHFSSQLITAVGSVMATMAYHLGYSSIWITMISSLFADLANPIYAFGGTLISFLGCMPSGNPATVAINGIGNALLHRCFFYEMWIEQYGSPPAVGAFRHYVAMGFVGDDSIGGVHEGVVGWFNMKSYQKWLANLGMPYTPADKSSAMPRHVHLRDTSLCKRKFVVRNNGVVDAPIELESIFKSMHMMHKNHQEAELVTSLNVTQGLRELARWDKATFDYYAPLIRKACKKIDLEVVDIDRPFDSWREEIVCKYNNVEQIKPLDDVLSIIYEG